MTWDLETLRRFFAASPYMQDLGVEVTACSAGKVSTRLPIKQRFFQHTAQVHAGVMATLADHTMGSAAQTRAPEGFVVVTAELKTSVLRPGRGEYLVCHGSVIKAGRMLSFVEAEVYALAGEQQTLVMKASATMALTAGELKL
jgi:uncharacterized protein (TIGR00369 family)